MTIRIAILALLSAASAAFSVYASDPVGEPTLVFEDSKQLQCSPKVLDPDDTLILTLGPMHGSELAITRVADRWPYFLVVRNPPGEMKPLMTPKQFKAATRVEIPVRIEAFPWVKNGKMERLFSKPGKYDVYVSEILESEVGGYSCTVEYRGDAR